LAITLGGASVTGLVRAVKEDKSSDPPRWFVTLIPRPVRG